MGAYIKENWLFVVVAVYLVSMVLYGHYRGFVRLAVSAVSLVLSLGVVHFGAPSVANLLRSNEVVYQAVEDSVTKFIQKDDEAENEAADAAPPSVQRSIIEEMDLPEQLKDALLENNNSEVYEALGTGITADSSAWQSRPFPWCCRWGWFILVRRLSRICFAAMRWSIRRWRTA